MFSGDRRLPLKDFLYINLKGIGKFGQRGKAAFGNTLPGIEECCCIFEYPAHVMAEADEFLRSERAGRVPLREGHLGSKKV